MKRGTKKTRNPYGNTAKRKAALAYLAARGITQPKPLYPMAFVGLDMAKGPDRTAISAHRLVMVRGVQK